MRDLTLSTRFLSAVEVADFVGVSPKTVTRWAREGKGPRPYYINGATRFDEADVIDWIKAQQSEQRKETNGN